MIAQIFLNAAYVLTSCALLARDILWLRGFLLTSQSCFITYAILADNFSMTVWNTVFIAVNVVQTARVWWERRPILLPPEPDDIHRKVFSIMTPREFLYFWETGRFREVDGGRIIREGEEQKELSLIVDGKVSVVKDGREVARLSRGNFIAEMSFLTDEPASADVCAEGLVRIVSWDQDKLANLKQVNPNLLIQLQAILGKDLSRKLKALSAGRKKT